MLSTFPDFVNWASTAVTFKVHVGPLALDAAVVSPARRTDLWSALFPANTPIRSYVFPSYSGRRVKSYPAANVRAYLRDFYLWALQNHPSDFPSLTDLVGRPDLPGGPPPVAGRLDAIRFGLRPGGGATIDTEQAVEAQIESALTAQKAIPAGPPSPASDLIQLKRFHRRDPVTSPPPPPAVPDIDFHQMVGLLGDHPHLQRLLGLVFDLEVPWSSGAPQSPLWVKPTWVPDFFAHPVAGRTNVNVMPFTVTTAAFRAGVAADRHGPGRRFPAHGGSQQVLRRRARHRHAVTAAARPGPEPGPDRLRHRRTGRGVAPDPVHTGHVVGPGVAHRRAHHRPDRPRLERREHGHPGRRQQRQAGGHPAPGRQPLRRGPDPGLAARRLGLGPQPVVPALCPLQRIDGRLPHRDGSDRGAGTSRRRRMGPVRRLQRSDRQLAGSQRTGVHQPLAGLEPRGPAPRQGVEHRAHRSAQALQRQPGGDVLQAGDVLCGHAGHAADAPVRAALPVPGPGG